MLDTEIIETNFCMFDKRFTETRDFLRKKYPNKYQEEEIKGFEKEASHNGARDAHRVRVHRINVQIIDASSSSTVKGRI